MKQHRVWLLASLTLFAFCCPPSSTARIVWTDDDWSGGRHGGTQGIDPEIHPGALVLDNQMDDFRVIGDSAPWQGYWSLTVYHDTLFAAASDYPYMFDGAEVRAYDYATNTMAVVYEPYESGLHLIKTIGDTIYVPGPDSMDPWEMPGSFYRYDGHEWVEKETLPTAIHVNDIEVVNGKLYATTGHATGDMNGYGCVWMSEDYGDTFTRVLTLYPNVDDLYRRFWALGHFGDLVFAQPDGSPPESERIYATVDGTNWFTYPVTNMPVETMAKFIPWNGDTLLMAMENRLYIWANGVWAARTMPFGLTRWGRGMHVYEGRLYGAGDNGRMYRWQRGSRWELVCDLPVNADSLHCGAMATLYGRVFLTAFNPFHGYEGKFLVSASIPSGQLFSLPHDFGTETTAGVLSWDDVRPGVGDVAALQLRSGATIMEMATSPFVGPDGTSATYYETSPAPIGEGHHGDRYFQYRVQLRCPDETWMPLVKSVTLEVDSLHSGAVGPEPSGRGAAHLRLDSIAPNPVQNLAHLRFSLVAESDRVIDASSAVIHVRICDLQGRRIRGASVRLAAGRGEWRWDLRDDYGHRVTAGVYRAVLSSADGILPASRAWVVM